MSDPSKAVFLSYARDDAAAARRIAEALRASGLEVWFDENELRGGDTWDAKIRQQIDACALFVPVISAHTQERGKGYFRLEWKLAVEQTHLMAEGMAFLAPVVIDDTRETGAVVPPEFMKVQWTRLPGALPTPQFVEQVKRLLGGKPLEAGRPRPAVAGVVDPGPASTRPATTKGLPGWMWGIAITAIVAVTAGILQLRKPEPTPATPSLSTPAVPTQLIVPLAADKSIAVLPFTNMSEEKDASAFFADGIHEDILTNLALIRELRVVSRTSVMSYRGTTKPMKQIAQELGVTYILEGSVRRSGNKVRVTGQLIHAATDEHIWAQAYDRDLTDIFTIQAELSSQIAGALKAALSPEEKVQLARRPTTNPAAYDLLLRARELNRNGNDTREELAAQEEMLQRAVALDAGFAGAWAALCATHAQIIFNNFDVSADRLAKARTAIEAAQRLESDNPEVIGGSGQFYYYALRDYPRALEYFERMTRQWPNYYHGFFMTGLVQRRQGRWAESLANLRRAAELDPGSAEQARNLMVTYRAVRRFDEAIAEQARRVRLLPESLRESFELARLQYFATGSTREADALLAGPIAERAAPQGFRKLWALTRGDLATAVRLEREFPDEWGELIGITRFSALQSAIVLAAAGDLPAARARLEKVPAELRTRLGAEPENPGVWANLARVEAVLGHKEEALAAARKALGILSEANDTLSGSNSRMALIFALAWTGDKAAACAELRRHLTIPSAINVYELKNGLWFTPLKGDPAFEAIVNDPKNNAPLF